MADEETPEETTEEPVVEEQAPEEAAAPSEEPAAEAAQEAPAEEAAPKEEPVAEAVPEAAKTEAPAAAAPAGDDEDEGDKPPAPTHPKEIRKLRRSQHDGTVKPERSAEERHQERAERRRKLATSRTAYRKKTREKTKAAKAANPTAVVAPEASVPGQLKLRQGVVVSDKADKTITVRIDMARRHRRYEKIIRSSKTLHAHDETNDANIGDTVRVIESRPLSRTKRWRLVEVVERAR